MDKNLHHLDPAYEMRSREETECKLESRGKKLYYGQLLLASSSAFLQWAPTAKDPREAYLLKQIYEQNTELLGLATRQM